MDEAYTSPEPDDEEVVEIKSHEEGGVEEESKQEQQESQVDQNPVSKSFSKCKVNDEVTPEQILRESSSSQQPITSQNLLRDSNYLSNSQGTSAQILHTQPVPQNEIQFYPQNPAGQSAQNFNPQQNAAAIQVSNETALIYKHQNQAQYSQYSNMEGQGSQIYGGQNVSFPYSDRERPISEGRTRPSGSAIQFVRQSGRQNQNLGYIQQSQGSVVKKKRQRKIFGGFDKERMHDQALGLKLQLNQLQDENLKLRTQCLVYENEIKKAEKMLYDAQQSNNQGKTAFKKDSLLVMNLKTQLKEQHRKIQEKDNEIFNIRQNIKLTHLSELQTECQTYYAECLRLRAIIDEYFINKGMDPKQVGEMGNMLSALQEENNQMNLALQVKDQENFRLQQEIEQRGRQLNQMSHKVQNSPAASNRVKALQKDQEKFKQEIKALKRTLELERKLNQEKSEKHELEALEAKKAVRNVKEAEKKVKQQHKEEGIVVQQLTTELENKDKILSDKDQVIQDLQKQLSRLQDTEIDKNKVRQQIEEQSRQIAEQKETEILSKTQKITSLQDEITNLKQQLEEQKSQPITAAAPQQVLDYQQSPDRLHNTAGSQHSSTGKKDASGRSVRQWKSGDGQAMGNTLPRKQGSTHFQLNQSKDYSDEQFQRDLIPSIKWSEIEYLTKILKREFQLVQKQVVDINIFPETLKQISPVSIKQLTQYLQDSFKSINKEEAILLSRFMIEGQQEEVEFNDEQSKPMLQLKNDFLKIITQTGYRVYNDQQMIDQTFSKISTQEVQAILKTDIHSEQSLLACLSDKSQLTEEEKDFLCYFGLKESQSAKVITSKNLCDQIEFYHKQQQIVKLSQVTSTIKSISRHIQVYNSKGPSTVLKESKYNEDHLQQQLIMAYYKLSQEEAQKLSMYLLQNTDASGYEIAKLLQQNMSNLGHFAYQDELIREVLPKMDQVIDFDTNKKEVQVNEFYNLLDDFDLDQRDKEVLAVFGLRASDSLSHINLQKFEERLEGQKQIEQTREESVHDESDQEEQKRKFSSDSGKKSKSSKSSKKAPSSKSSSHVQITQSNHDGESEAQLDVEGFLSSEEAIKIGQDSYMKLATLLNEHQLTVRKAFGDNIVHTQIEGQEEEIITIDDFRQVLEAIGYGQLTDKETLIFNARMGSFENVLLLKYLIEDMDKMGLPQDTFRAAQSIERPNPNQDSLDILKKLLDYCEKMSMSLDQIFEDEIEEAEAEPGSTYKIIETESFFQILSNKGIINEQNSYENLFKLICYDPNQPEYILFDRVKEILAENQDQLIVSYAFNSEQTQRDKTGDDYSESGFEEEKPSSPPTATNPQKLKQQPGESTSDAGVYEDDDYEAEDGTSPRDDLQRIGGAERIPSSSSSDVEDEVQSKIKSEKSEEEILSDDYEF